MFRKKIIFINERVNASGTDPCLFERFFLIVKKYFQKMQKKSKIDLKMQKNAKCKKMQKKCKKCKNAKMQKCKNAKNAKSLLRFLLNFFL